MSGDATVYGNGYLVYGWVVELAVASNFSYNFLREGEGGELVTIGSLFSGLVKENLNF